MALIENGYTETTKKNWEQWGSREYKVLNDGSGGGSFSADTSSAQVSYLCEYNFLNEFVDAVLGKTVKSGTTLVRSAATSGPSGSLPEAHMYYSNFWAVGCDVEPVGIAKNSNPPPAAPGHDNTKGPNPIWRKAQITVQFRPAPYFVLSDVELSGVSAPYTGWPPELGRFVTRTPDVQIDMLSLGGVKFKFVSGQRVLDLSPSQPSPFTGFKYTWHRVPALANDLGKPPNMDTILELGGTVNSEIFDGYKPGAVLFLGVDPKLVLPSVAVGGSYYWDITYLFKVRDTGETNPYVSAAAVGWQFVYDPIKPGGPGYDLVTSDGTPTGRKLYPEKDLNDLFKVTW